MGTGWSLRGLRPSRSDALLAAIALVCVQIEVWGFWVVEEQGERLPAALFAAGMALPVAWLRVAPVAGVVGVLGAHLIWMIVAVPQGSLIPFLIELGAVFACALRAPWRTAAAVLAGAIGIEVLFVARTTNDFADYLFILSFLTGAWLAGRALRSRQQQADRLFAENVRLQVEREERARQAADDERARIAREMHDIISHGVSVMVVQAAGAEQVLDRDPVAAREALRAVQDVGREARVELRRMLGLMRSPVPEGLSPQPDLDQLPALLEQMHAAGLDVRVVTAGRPADLPAGVALTAYRVVQEALTNALAHGRGGRADLTVTWGPNAVDIEVCNDAERGIGGPERSNGTGGHGLLGMRERVQLYGGRLEHGPGPEGGYRLAALLPYGGTAS